MNNRLNEKDKAAFEQALAEDTDLQELLEAAKSSRDTYKVKEYSSEELEKLPDLVDDENDEMSMRKLVETAFPPGSVCRTTLISYYFEHRANYEPMVYAIKRPTEDFKTVYGRIARQVSRCIEKIKKRL